MIAKKTWKPFFQWIKDGRKNVEIRLADFELHVGDQLWLKECDQRTKEYTGREIVKKVKWVKKVNLTNFNSIAEIHRFGHYVIEFERDTIPVDPDMRLMLDELKLDYLTDDAHLIRALLRKHVAEIKRVRLF